jgi:ATP phosphoribosyltransferase
MLTEAGYLRGVDARELAVQDVANDVEFFFLRPKDIALYVGEGTLDLGITGLDMLLDAGASAEVVLELGFGASSFRIAAPHGAALVPRDLSGLRIATSYPGILNTWLREKGISARVVRLDGAVENAVALGVADAVADVVATGNTLRRAGLEVIGEVIVASQALLIKRSGAASSSSIETFVRRLSSVLVARAYVLVDYDIPTSLVERACGITPGIESPTVSTLHDPSWSAIRAMVPAERVHAVMDELYAIGARGILVTDIHACRL